MIVLFREGTSHVYKGITCEVSIVSEFGFEGLLENGWVLNPKDLYKETPKEKDTETKAESKVTITKKPEVPAKGLKASNHGVTSPKSAPSVPKK